MNRLDDGQSPSNQPPHSAENVSGNGRAHDTRSPGPLPGQRVLGLKEAAVYLGCCERTVKELILDGVLPQVALTSRIQVDILDLDKLIASKKKVYTYQD